MLLVQTITLFVTLINREIKTEKLKKLSFSVLIFLFFKVIKRVFVTTNHTVIVAKRVYDFLFRIPLFFNNFM